MNIFITGGTGFIGKHLVKNLTKEGHFLYVLARDPEKARDIAGENVNVVKGTIEDPETYRHIFENPIDAVYHLAAIPGERWGWKQEDYDRINVRATENILDVCEGKIKLFVFCSSINAIENQAGFHRFPYGKSKNKAEKTVLARKNFKTVILRPAIVYGPEDKNGVITQLCRMIKNKKFFIIGRGKNILPLVYIDDLVSAFTKALNVKETSEILEISGPDNLTIKNISDVIAEKLGTKLPSVYIPVWIARIVAYASEEIFPLLGREPLVTQRRIDMMTKNNPINHDRAREIVDYDPKTNFSEGLNNTIDWMKQNGLL